MQWLKAGSAAALSVALTACHHQSALPPSVPHYVIGTAWQADGSWFYPEETFELRQTGLAVRDTNTTPRITTDGEAWSASAMTGAHQTLQLPAIVTVRNLSNGRTVRIRLNDRGPGDAGRVLSVTPSVAALLGMGDTPTPVEIVEDEAASREIAESSPDSPRLAISTAPRGDVTAQSLSGGTQQIVGRSEGQEQTTRQGMALRDLPVQVTQGVAQDIVYNVDLGGFAGRAAALRVAAQCGGTVARITENGHGLSWQAKLGPFRAVVDADRGLANARSCGIAGARIVVE